MPARCSRTLTLVIAGAAAISVGQRAAAQTITPNAFAPAESEVDIELRPAFRADLNRDGAINASDLRLFLETRKAGASGNLVTDINADGILDQLDLAVVLELIAAKAAPPKALASDDASGRSGPLSRPLMAIVGQG